MNAWLLVGLITLDVLIVGFTVWCYCYIALWRSRRRVPRSTYHASVDASAVPAPSAVDLNAMAQPHSDGVHVERLSDETAQQFIGTMRRGIEGPR